MTIPYASLATVVRIRTTTRVGKIPKIVAYGAFDETVCTAPLGPIILQQFPAVGLTKGMICPCLLGSSRFVPFRFLECELQSPNILLVVSNRSHDGY